MKKKIIPAIAIVLLLGISAGWFFCIQGAPSPSVDSESATSTDQTAGDPEKPQDAAASEDEEDVPDETLTARWAPKPGSALLLGETLKYDIRWTGIHAGWATMTVSKQETYKNRPVYLVESTTKSNSFLSVFYKVNDTIESKMDMQTLAPLFYEKKLNEGNHKRHEYINFAPEERTAYYYKKNFKTGKFKKRVIKNVPPNAQDPLSMLYYLRFLDFTVGDEVVLSICTDKKHWTISFLVEKEEEIELRKVGKFPAYKLKPKFKFEGLFVHKGDITIWIHKEHKYPLIMHADIPIGYVEVSLIRRTGVTEGEVTGYKKEKKAGRRRLPG